MSTEKIRTAAELDALVHARAFARDVQEVINDDAGDDPDPQWVHDRLVESLAVINALAAALSAPAPAPSVVPEAAVEAAASAVRKERAFSAAAAFGVPIDDVPYCAEMIARSALTAALPLLTAAPSATREAVEAVIFEADDECVLEVHEVRSLASRLLARFTITPKEDR